MTLPGRRSVLALAVAFVLLVAGLWFWAPPSLPETAVDDGQGIAALGSTSPEGTESDATHAPPGEATGSPSGSAKPKPTSDVDPSGEPAPSTDPGGPRPTVSSATPDLVAALDAKLEKLRAKYGMPGISASIVFADGSVWQGADGLADIAADRPVTIDTEFSVASVSKTFTAALILALIDDGRLTLDTTARTYLPDLKISRKVTVRELLDHTSGLRDFFYNANIDHALLVRPGRTWDAARSLRYLGPAYSKPGRSWHYSNTNYLILGMLAEAVGRAPVADQLRARFFGPLGLDHTYYQAVETPRGPVARGYRFLGTGPDLPAIDLSDRSETVPFTSVVTAAGAAGSIATSAVDLAHWGQDLYGGQVLSPAMRAAMVADLQVTARYVPGVAYGLGVQSVVIDGHPTLGHSGRFLGARAAVRWLADEGSAISVLTNQSRSDPNVVVKALLKVAYPD